jgi:hypothetical protein
MGTKEILACVAVLVALSVLVEPDKVAARFGDAYSVFLQHAGTCR